MGLPLLRFLFRKMWNNRWLTLSSLLGLTVAVAFTMSIPMYSDGALKRVVASSLKQRSNGLPAGSLLIRYQASGNDKTDLGQLKDETAYIEKDIPKQIGFPSAAYAKTLEIRGTSLSPVDPEKVDPSKRRQMNIVTMNDFADHADIENGKLFTDKASDGEIEALVSEDARFRNDVDVGDEFRYPIYGVKGISELKVKIVGTYKPKDETDPYWYQGTDGIVNSFVVSPGEFQNLLEKDHIPLNMATWYYAFDLRDIQSSQLGPLERTLNRIDIELYARLNETKVDISFKDMLGEFKLQSLLLQTLLFTLAAPMIAMVFYYIAMNSRQALDKQRSDIAVLRSRGGSTRQIVWIYLLEGLVLGGLSLVLGSFLGWFLAKSIGSSNGFLMFVNRKSIPVDVSYDSFLYGLAAVAIAIGASVIPAVSYARSSIVGIRQRMARSDRKPVWHRWYLDVALLALCGYGYYQFNQQQFLSLKTGLTSDQLQVQPLLFFVPALAIFAAGLFFLRIFPWLLRLFSWLGRKFLPVPLYLTLTQLSRSAAHYYPLMLLLILTLGLGIYNSSAARTIDLNSTERTLYKYGADVVVQTAWEADVASIGVPPQNGGQNGSGGSGNGNGSGGSGGGSGGGAGGSGGGSGGNGGGSGGNGGNGGGQNGGGGMGGGNPPAPQQMLYVEPPFELYRTLPGVEAAARVLRTKGSLSVSGKSAGQATIMGIDNVDFAKVAWFRNDLFPVHPYKYLDQMGKYVAEGCLVPTSFAEQYQIKPGDHITVGLEGKGVDFIVVATVPYWPTQYPDEMPFVIANLSYIYDQVPLMPYEVWLKMKDGARVTPVVEALADHDMQISSIEDVRNELVVQSKQPSRGGVFGILSLGFLISVLISLIGYVLYWFFHLTGRVVQFGVLRAMGLSRKQLTGMLLLEQIFTAGLSIALGVGIGRLASTVFLPFLQTADSAKLQVPPFRIVFRLQDTLQLLIVVLVMMSIGAALLLLHIRRLRVHQAVKLGEER